jgi:hypothetical protein
VLPINIWVPGSAVGSTDESVFIRGNAFSRWKKVNLEGVLGDFLPEHVTRLRRLRAEADISFRQVTEDVKAQRRFRCRFGGVMPRIVKEEPLEDPPTNEGVGSGVPCGDRPSAFRQGVPDLEPDEDPWRGVAFGSRRSEVGSSSGGPSSGPLPKGADEALWASIARGHRKIAAVERDFPEHVLYACNSDSSDSIEPPS